MLLRLIPQTTTLKGAIFRNSAMAFAAQRATAESSEANLACPRCESTNTKFCYYNNYNLSQPRHFCKDCRRYWTKGGSLRNVPVGGGTRKSKRPPSSSSSKRPSPASSDPQKPDLFDRQMLDVSGSFSSLLSSTPQFGCFFECCAPLDSCPLLRPPPRPTFDDATAPPSVPENFFGLAADWPDLSIYTPGAGFQ